MKSIVAPVLALWLATQYVASGEASPRVYAVPKTLAVGPQAPTFDTLVEQARPTFTWGARDLLWIRHNSNGKPFFEMNRAYHLRLDGGEAFYLLEETSPFAFTPDEQVEYIRHADQAPSIVARHSRFGVVYQANWPSPMHEGTGHWEYERHIYLLCDGEHRWHLIGEGPQTSTGKAGSDHFSSEIETDVAWTAKMAQPLELHLTQITHRETLGEPPGESPLDTRRDFVLGGKLPAKLKSDGGLYILLSKSRSLDSLAGAVAYWFAVQGNDVDQRTRQKALATTKKTLRQSNPELPDDIPAGRRVILDEKLLVRGAQ
jgi:hypothetical protein